MFRMKQIAMVAILGLALVLATATVFATTQSAQAQACPFESCGPGVGSGPGLSGPGLPSGQPPGLPHGQVNAPHGQVNATHGQP